MGRSHFNRCRHSPDEKIVVSWFTTKYAVPCQIKTRILELRWLEIVSNTYILMGRYNHSLLLDATIMVSKDCPTIGEHIVTIFEPQ